MSSAAPARAPTVSVVMAAYNGAAFLRETIDSVLAQTMTDFEIIVVDDVSTDDTLAVLAAIDDPRLRVIRAPYNGGPAVARNWAMAEARGAYIAGLDQDDICLPERFERQLAYLDAHPDVVLVATTIEMFEGKRVRRDSHPDLADPDEIDWTMDLLNPLGWSTVMMRGEAARRLDPFERDDRRYAEDYDLYTRIRAFGRIGRIAEPLVRYRLHAGGASQAHREAMDAAAARVLADRYADQFGEDAMDAALLMTRHGASGAPPPNSRTLARCGEIIATLLDARGGRAADFAWSSASEFWWRMARSGLRKGRYGVAAMLHARPAFARTAGGLTPVMLRDAAIGAGRRGGLRT